MAAFEGTIGDAADNFERFLNNGDGKMGAIVYEGGDVVFWHLRQLFLKDTFKACKDDEGFAFVVVVHYTEFDLAVALFDDGGLGKY